MSTSTTNALERRACALALELRMALHQLARDPEMLARVRRHFKVSEHDGQVLPDGFLIQEGSALPMRIWDLHCELNNLMLDPDSPPSG